MLTPSGVVERRLLVMRTTRRDSSVKDVTILNAKPYADSLGMDDASGHLKPLL